MLAGAGDNGEDAMTHTLVPSDRVEHAAVFGRDGAKLGTTERLMLEKVTGTVAMRSSRLAGCSAVTTTIRWRGVRSDMTPSATPTKPS
jgi:hypothetical protein